jgi:hypothetical protein
MKRCTALLAILLAVSGCGGDSTAPDQGFATWRLDGITCTGSGPIQFFVDGALIGTETLSAGGPASKAYPVTVGTHLVGAKEATFTWPNTSVSITAGLTYTSVLTCD